MRRVPRYSLAELVEHAEIRVGGAARPLGAALEAPISGRICVCYAVVVYAWRESRVTTLHTDQARAPFVLEDGAARAVVEPARARLSLLADHTAKLVPSDTDQTRELLAKVGIAGRDLTGITVLELDESIIELGERIAVVGTAVRETDLDAAPAGYRDDERPARWRLIPTAVSDDPRMLR